MPLWNEHLASRKSSGEPAARTDPPMPTGYLECDLEWLRSSRDFIDADDTDDDDDAEQAKLLAQWNQWLESTGRTAAIDRFLDAMPVSRKDQASLLTMARALADFEASGFDPKAIIWTWLPDEIVSIHLSLPDCIAER